ncbi:MAG: hypothetical protein PWP24_824 [Clostridiales bacterium]|nr:hypothetical protein [Clostridiales bacterium]
MTNAYLFEETEQEIYIKSYQLEDLVVDIPERIQGKPVTKLLPYAFQNKRVIKKVRIPETVREIGSHCFYDCRGLNKIVLHDSVDTIADGALKNCFALNAVTIFAKHGNMSGLKGILSEVKEEILGRIYYGEKRERVDLIFPRYLHDYEENTMARIINQVTYGCGIHYRECVSEEGIDFHAYDAVFPFTKANEQKRVVEHIALLRLQYPKDLWPSDREAYLAYLEEHMISAGRYFIQHADIEPFLFLVSLPVAQVEVLNQLLEFSRAADQLEFVTALLKVKAKRFGRQKKTFEW